MRLRRNLFKLYLFALDNPPYVRLFFSIPFDSIPLVLNELNSIIVHYIDFVLSHSIREPKILACDKFHSIHLTLPKFYFISLNSAPILSVLFTLIILR